MSRTIVKRNIAAPAHAVFHTVSEIKHFAKAVPDIVSAEIVSEVQSGVGTRFRETRLMNGKQATTELEVTEYVANERIRMVADSHGTLWDSVFTVTPRGDTTDLELTMEARPKSLMAKLATPMMKGMLQKALEKDMDAVKRYCEGSTSADDAAG